MGFPAVICNVTKCQEASAGQPTQKQSDEAWNDSSAKAIAASSEDEDPKNHVQEITAKDPPTENVHAYKTTNM